MSKIKRHTQNRQHLCESIEQMASIFHFNARTRTKQNVKYMNKKDVSHAVKMEKANFPPAS